MVLWSNIIAQVISDREPGNEQFGFARQSALTPRSGVANQETLGGIGEGESPPVYDQYGHGQQEILPPLGGFGAGEPLEVDPNTAHEPRWLQIPERLGGFGDRVSADSIATLEQLGIFYSQGTDGTRSELYQRMTIRQLEKARRSYQALIEEHEKKLAEYIANPDAYDKQGTLQRAAPELRQRIIDGRIRQLQEQIRKQRGELDKIDQELERRQHGE